MAKVIAERPSVKISVQLSDLFVPAQMASSNFGIPYNLFFLLPSVFLVSSLLSFNLQKSTISSTMELLYILSINLSETVTLTPKSFEGVVNCSFV